MDNDKIYEDEEEEFGIAEALERMDEGFILSYIVDKRRNYCCKKNGKILIASGEMKAPLSPDDFRSLYAQTLFTLVKDDEPLVDPEKDQQYYSWGKEM
jgi:hypothetical protein